MKKISVVIPCYRSEQTVAGVVGEIKSVITADGRYDYEIVLVNDYSPDNTIGVLRELAKDPKIKVVDLMKNFGQHSALMAGYHFVTGDYVLSLDDDGQNPPSEMFKLIDALTEGDYDWVSAKYGKKKKHSFIRKIGSKVSFLMAEKLIGKPKDFDINSYCVVKKAVIDEIIRYDGPYPYVHGLMLRATRNVKNVDIDHKNRLVGESGYSLKKLFELWMNGFTAFSVKPLRLATLVGFVMAAAGFLEWLFVLIYNIFATVKIGMVHYALGVVLLAGGLILLALGLLGEYMGRIYINQNRAPQFVIKEVLNAEEKSEE